MAHFEMKRTRVSQRTITSLRGEAFKYELWGPFDRNGDEVKVQLRPAAGAGLPLSWIAHVRSVVSIAVSRVAWSRTERRARARQRDDGPMAIR